MLHERKAIKYGSSFLNMLVWHFVVNQFERLVLSYGYPRWAWIPVKIPLEAQCSEYSIRKWWSLLLITVDKILISIVSLINLNFFGLLQVRLMRSPLFLPPYVADVELVPSAGETLWYFLVPLVFVLRVLFSIRGFFAGFSFKASYPFYEDWF